VNEQAYLKLDDRLLNISYNDKFKYEMMKKKEEIEEESRLHFLFLCHHLFLSVALSLFMKIHSDE
jgi:hypothetical protein